MNPRRAAATLLAAFAVLPVLATAASAHVTVSADDSAQGADDSVLQFRVPDESDTASTTTLTVTFPVNDPLASVRPAPKPGWTVTTRTVTFGTPITTDDGVIKTGVGTVTWTAEKGKGIAPGEFDQFAVLVGPLPHETALTFPAVQTYSDGTKVSWIDPLVAGQAEPEHPAPTLQLTGAAASSTSGGSAQPAGGGSNRTIAGIGALVLVVIVGGTLLLRSPQLKGRIRL